MKKITKGKKKGFTLIELIAVIAILAILAAIIIPNVISYIDNANKSAIKTNAATANTAIITAETSISNGLTTPVAKQTLAVFTEAGTTGNTIDWSTYNSKKTVSNFESEYKTYTGKELVVDGTSGENSVGSVIIEKLPTVMQTGTK